MQAQKDDEALTTIPSQQLLTGLRILIVDDSEINREVAELIFVNEGAYVTLANDGQQALDWLQSHSTEVDIVLMDLQMPVMNGCEATRKIRLMPDLAELPVIAMTAGTFIEQSKLAHEVGMNGFITKPFEVDVAIELILKLMEGAEKVIPLEISSHVPLAPAMDPDLPGLAVGYALSIWKDALSYQQYLRKFARDYANSIQLISSSETSDAAALAHKLKGAAGSLGIPLVSALAGEVAQRFYDGEETSESMARLQAALNIALNSIACYAPPSPDVNSGQYKAVDPEQIALLFSKMLDALNTDSTTVIRPMMVELDSVLPPSSLLALHRAVENFDFREGEAVIRMLANELNILMEP